MAEAFATLSAMVRSADGEQGRCISLRVCCTGNRHGASHLWAPAGADMLGTLYEVAPTGLAEKGSLASKDSVVGHRVFAASKGLATVTAHIRLVFLERAKVARVF